MRDAPLRFAAPADAGWLYDCHAQRFAPVEHGACMATGFAPLYLSQLFDVPIADWIGTLTRVAAELAALPPEARDAVIAAHPPRKPAGIAAEIALLTYPSAEAFITRERGDHAPFALRPEVLMQPNVELATAQAWVDGAWRDVDGWALDGAAGRRAVRDAILDAARGDAPPPPAPGCYVVGHSSLLIRGRRAGLLLDPVPRARVGAGAGYSLATLRALSDAVALTHGHFDHYHVPSLLGLADRPILVPEVPRASVVCEDLAQRLRSFGLDQVAPAAWGSVTSLDGITAHALPFVGEQFLTAEEHPEVRNWGCAWVVQTEDLRVLVVADSGFEPGRSVIDVVSDWVAANGPVDVVVAQAIGLHAGFGMGDPDSQLTALTCAHRATETFALLDPSRRITLAVEDLPALVAASGAGTVVLHGQFERVPGRPAVAPALVEAARAVLDVPVPALRVGEGVATRDGARCEIS